MEEERLIQHLKNIIQERGGKRKKKSQTLKRDLAEYNTAFKNPYVNDGSLEYRKTRAKIVKQLADLYGFGEKLFLVPEKDVDDEMARLRKLKQDEIDEKYDKVVQNKKLVDKEQRELKKAEYLNKIVLRDGVAPPTRKQISQFANNEMEEIESLDKKVKPDKKTKLTTEELKALYEKLKPDAKFDNTGKGRKRKPSAYNKFVSQYRKKGYSMKEIGKMWSSK